MSTPWWFFLIAAGVLCAAYLSLMWLAGPPDISPEEEALREAVNTAVSDPARLEKALEAARAAGALIWSRKC